METQAVTLNFGNTVHVGIKQSDGLVKSVLCGAEFTKSQYSRMATIYKSENAPTCKRCIKSKNAAEWSAVLKEARKQGLK